MAAERFGAAAHTGPSMGKSETPRIEALDALLAGKRKHEGYLAKLEERRAGTPEHVFVRLRDEYLAKLTDLQVRASAEAEALTESLREDETAVREIESRLAAVIEERVEGALRAEVGEYEPKEWAKKLETLSANVSRIEKERDLRSESFKRTRDLLVEAKGPEAVAAKGAELAGTPSFDDLAFSKSSVALPVPPAPAPNPKGTPASKPAVDEEPVPVLGKSTPRSSQAVKTLKCAECGTLNYPTEWYCERCGGELAAL